MVIPRSTLAGSKVQFKVRRTRTDVAHRLQGFGRKAGTAKIGVDDDTRRVDHGTQVRLANHLNPICKGAGKTVAGKIRQIDSRAAQDIAAQRVQCQPQGAAHFLVAIGGDHFGNRWLLQQRIDLWQMS